MYIGQLEQDALQLQEEIQREIEQHWKPPVGLGDDVVCQIQAIIGWDGTVHSLHIQQKSGVLAYDMHARSAVLAMKFPEAAWVKN